MKIRIKMETGLRVNPLDSNNKILELWYILQVRSGVEVGRTSKLDKI